MKATPNSTTQRSALKRMISNRGKAVQRGRRYAKSDDYELKQFVKFPDLMSDKEFVFPLRVKARRKWVKKKRLPFLEKNESTGTNMHFSFLTGNELLVAFQDIEKFNNKELFDALKAFTRLNQIHEFDWNSHPIFENVLDSIFKRMDSFTWQQYIQIIKELEYLRIEDTEIWLKIAEMFEKMHPRLKGDDFGYVYNFIMKLDYVEESLKQDMTVLLPRELEYMNMSLLIEAFTLVVDHGFLNEYNWEYHFHMNMWKRPHEMNVRDYARAINTMIDIDYFEHIEFYNVEFLPYIGPHIAICDNSKDCLDLREALLRLKGIDKRIEIRSYVKKLEERADYVENKLPLVLGTSFPEFVKKDLKYYEEQEKLRLELERRGRIGTGGEEPDEGN